MVEGKVDERFRSTIGKWLRDASPGKLERLGFPEKTPGRTFANLHTIRLPKKPWFLRFFGSGVPKGIRTPVLNVREAGIYSYGRRRTYKNPLESTQTPL